MTPQICKFLFIRNYRKEAILASDKAILAIGILAIGCWLLAIGYKTLFETLYWLQLKLLVLFSFITEISFYMNSETSLRL